MEQKINSVSSAETKDDNSTIVEDSVAVRHHNTNAMLPAVLSKEEAISLMKEGKKVTHRYFSDDEWIKMRGNIIVMEMGQQCWASEFWRDRQGDAWETGWSLYGR